MAEPPVRALDMDGSDGTKPPNQDEDACDSSDAWLLTVVSEAQSSVISLACGMLTWKPVSSTALASLSRDWFKSAG